MTRIYQSPTMGDAHVRVALVRDIGQADLLVHRVGSWALARGPARWYITRNKQDADLYIALRECATMADLTRLQPDIARLTNGRRKAAIAVFEECKAKLAPPKPAK